MTRTREIPTFGEYLTVGEAAEFLGVSPWTLRNWDKSGKLKSSRHPVSGYRIYRQEDLEGLLQIDSLLGKRRQSLVPNLDWSELGEREHLVQFYEDDTYLVESVSAYVSRGLAAGEAAVIIATAAHRSRIHRRLRRRGFDLRAARKNGQYLALDAAEALDKFMIQDQPDAARFEDAVGKVIRRMSEQWPRVRAFGEMVAILWAAGNRDGACRLEALWNDLATRHPFALLCAYPMNGFSEEPHGATLIDICNYHSRVIPAESYTSLTTPSEQLRKIALLQENARQLKAEIAQRKDAQLELCDFFDNALEGLHKVDPDGQIIWANQAELDLLGYQRDEYVGHHISEFYADREVIDDILSQLLKGERLVNRPARLRCKDGSIKHVLIHSSPRFKDGKFMYSRCFTRDVSEIRHAERDRAMLAAIIESSDDAIISKSLDGNIRSWNAGAERLFGYSADEAVGQPITIIIPPERHSEEREILARLRCGERIEHFETVRVAKDGRRLDISLTISPIRDSLGHLIGASKIARDITERKRIDAALRESEERFRRLVELLPVGVYTCEAPSGLITYFNEQATKLWGRTPRPGESDERFCGSFRLFRPDGSFLPHDQCPMATALQEGREFRNQEVVIEGPDGSRVTALVNIDPIRDADGRTIAAINVFHDVTLLKKAEQQLRDADRRKDEFLATLAHELRNPLAPIRNGLNILRMEDVSGPAAASIYEMMDRQTAHLVRLVDDLLELSRISRGKIELKREPVTLATVIQHAVETSKPCIDEAGHTLDVRLPDDSIVVEGDLVRLSQVFANLLNNAAKYTKKGGSISIVAKRDGNQAVVSVQDTGIGIPRDVLSQVFDMFAQIDNPLRRSQDGLGIGLSLVRSIVVMHGGNVEAHSNGLGHGSEFVVRLPIVESDSRKPECASRLNSEIANGQLGPRILVVDDNKDSANTLAMLLKHLGADVQIAYDGSSALEAVRISRPSIILMDLGMPGMDGCEVARLIRQDAECRKVLLIAMTGWGHEEHRRRSREAGFDHHLVKPVDLNALKSLLASCED